MQNQLDKNMSLFFRKDEDDNEPISINLTSGSHVVVQGALYIAGHYKQSVGSINLSLHCQQHLVIVESPGRWQNVFVWSIVLL